MHGIAVKIRFLINALKDFTLRAKDGRASRSNSTSFINSICINDQLNDWVETAANDSKVPQTRHDIIYLAYPKTTRTKRKILLRD